MLSKPERQRLAAIEFRLAEEEPQLAAKLQQFDNANAHSFRAPAIRWRLGTIAVLCLLALIGLLSGLVIVAAIVAVVGVAMGTWLLWRKASKGDGRSPD